MKHILSLPAAVLALSGLCGCISMGADHNAIYTAACPVVPDADMRARFRSIVEGVADQLRLPRPEVREIPRSGYLDASLTWRFAAAQEGQKARSGMIIFSERIQPWTPDKHEVDAVILGDPAKEDAPIKQVRAAIETELTRAGCGTWESHYQLKLS